MRIKFDEQLALLNHELIAMGALCEEAIATTARSVMDNDRSLAGRVRELEYQIDQKEREIETLCLKLLLQQQPVARDLRLISAALKMITDMERIGDQALDIADTAGFMGPLAAEDAGLLGDLARTVVGMVTDSVDAFVRQDRDFAVAVMHRDDEADALFDRIKKSIIDRLAQSRGEGEYALDLLMIAKYLERIGDHATNIAEWVEFAETGLYKGGEVI
ncbi:MAG TPA: phosphate signaling complex protein PhoU [Candidatus Scatomorpha stercoravium]|nr:phosphate signaling complex protein PhoU [Candidatus Scatomorpha stercoravium]